MIKTEEQFNAELANLTGVSIPRTPCKFITWNANGIKHRLAETNNEKKLKAFVEAENPDIFAVQEVHIAAHPELGRSFPMPGDNTTCYEEYKALFVNYDFYASFATTRAAGQIVAVSKKCEKPHVTYTFDTEKNETTPLHHREGRTIILDFPSVKVVCRYVPNNGMCDEKKLERRRTDDAVTYDYMTHYAAMSTKPLVYLGDLNVCHMNNDMSASADFWFEEGFFQRRPEKVHKDEKDQGFCGTTVNERTRFKEMLRASNLYDPGAVTSDEPNQALTWRGSGRYYGEGLRLDYILVSKTLANCIEEYRTNGYGRERYGFFGSDHCPVILELVQDWKYRAKNGCVVNVVEPTFLRKARQKKKKSKPYLLRIKNISEMRTQAMLNYVHLSAMFFLGALKKNSTYPAHEQYYTTHKKGTVDLPSGESIGFTSLWDTGASNANYISSEFYEKNEASLSPFVLPMKSSVTLGDRKTTLHLDSGLNLPISFFDDDGVKHEAMCDFMILPSTGRDMIIGMPSLITDFGAMFLRTIAEAVDKYNTSSNTGLNFSNNSFVHKNQAKKNVEAVNEINPVTLLRPYVTKKIEGPLHEKKNCIFFF